MKVFYVTAEFRVQAETDEAAMEIMQDGVLFLDRRITGVVWGDVEEPRR